MAKKKKKATVISGKKKNTSLKAKRAARKPAPKKAAKKKKGPALKKRSKSLMTRLQLTEKFKNLSEMQLSLSASALGAEGFETHALGCCEYRVDGESHCDTLTKSQCAAIPHQIPNAVLIGFTPNCTCPGDAKSGVEE